MKRYGVLVVVFMLSLLTACGSKDESGNQKSNALQNETEAATMGNDNAAAGEGTETKVSEGTEETTADQDSESADGAGFDQEAMKEAYQSILKGIYYDHTFPDGQACDWDDTQDMSQNQFAVYDIDQDGKDELILSYTTGSMAGMAELIYDFDNNTKTANEELREFPALTFYDNGIIQADWSHNQGLAGDFWPYTLYQYDSETDRYVNVAMVDAWDRSLSETNSDGTSFPAESDADGDGIVYYIMKDGVYALENPVDGAAYEQWRDSYTGTAQAVEVPFLNLTEENINHL